MGLIKNIAPYVRGMHRITTYFWNSSRTVDDGCRSSFLFLNILAGRIYGFRKHDLS